MVAAVVAGIVLLGGGGGAGAGGEGPAVSGLIGVNSGSGYPHVGSPDGNPFPGGSHDPGEDCIGRGQYGDVRPGALVTFFGADNAIVGTAELNVGQMQTAGGTEFCVMPFEGKLNKGSDAYQAQFGNGPKVTVDPAALQDVVLDAS